MKNTTALPLRHAKTLLKRAYVAMGGPEDEKDSHPSPAKETPAPSEGVYYSGKRMDQMHLSIHKLKQHKSLHHKKNHKSHHNVGHSLWHFKKKKSHQNNKTEGTPSNHDSSGGQGGNPGGQDGKGNNSVVAGG